jgi:hypothetical protein
LGLFLGLGSLLFQSDLHGKLHRRLPRSPLLASWGKFVPDPTPLAGIAAAFLDALKIMVTMDFGG